MSHSFIGSEKNIIQILNKNIKFFYFLKFKIYLIEYQVFIYKWYWKREEKVDFF